MGRLINIGLRIATLAGKFGLVFFLARFVEPSVVGLYGLIAVGVSYSLYIVGLDFYSYSTRNILREDRKNWGRLLRSQASLMLILYLTVLPIISVAFFLGFLPWSIAPWFYILLIVGHINQELGRLLLVASKQVMASLAIFLRQGLWGLCIVVGMARYPEMRDLNSVLAAWFVGEAIAFGLTLLVVRSLGIGGWRSKVDWGWVCRGLRIAVPLLVSTLALRGLFTLDRYWFAELNSLSVLGVYVLFIGFCNALISFLDAGVFVFAYPSMISAHHRDDRKAFKKEVRLMTWLTISSCAIFVLVSLILLRPMLVWLEKPVYVEYANLFYWLLIPTCIFLMSMIPHYILYSRGHDGPIILSHLAAIPVFIITTYIMTFISRVLAIPFGLTSAFFLILIWKIIELNRFKVDQREVLS